MPNKQCVSCGSDLQLVVACKWCGQPQPREEWGAGLLLTIIFVIWVVGMVSGLLIGQYYAR